MFTRFITVTLILSLATVASAADAKSLDDQFLAIATARTRADLAIRKMRALAEDSEGNWRTVSAATDAARGQILESLRKAVEDEQRRAEELRNPAVIDELNQRRATVEQDWQKFAAVDRPAIDASYRGATGALASVAQVFNTLTNVESVWKDSKIDLATLEAGYESVAKRAEELKAQAEKATADLIANQKLWEAGAKAVSQGNPMTSGGKKK